MELFKIQVLQGKQIIPYIADVSRMRIKHFRGFPYLYKGNIKYEKEYMQDYITNPKAILVIAFDEKQNLAAVSTGLPVASDRDLLVKAKPLFAKNNLDINDYYYIAETIIEQKYRGQGLYSKLVKIREQAAKNLGFNHICFLTVKRNVNHPLQPKNYQSPEAIFKHCGYTKTDMQIEYHWPTVQADGGIVEMENPLIFWVKSIYAV